MSRYQTWFIPICEDIKQWISHSRKIVFYLFTSTKLEKVRPSLDQNMNVINCLFWYQRYCGYLIDGGQKVPHKSIDLCHELEICQLSAILFFPMRVVFASTMYLNWTGLQSLWDSVYIWLGLCTMYHVQNTMLFNAGYLFCLTLDCFTFVFMTHVININSYYFLFNVML